MTLKEIFDSIDKKENEMFNNVFGTKAGKAKIDSQTAQVLELETQKKRLEIERDQIQLELNNAKDRAVMQLEKESHKQSLKLDAERAVFDREKKVWEVEKKEMLARFEREREEFHDSTKRESDLKIQEAVTLVKLDAQQKIKQSELDKAREVNALKTSSAEELSKAKSESAEQYYNKLTAAFQDIQMNGDKNSKFVQELALKVFERVPTNRTDIGVEISDVPQLKSAKR